LLPGEFVTEDLRDDCARFLDELRAQLSRRTDVAGEDPSGPSPAELDET
jgi:hypothetical protein